MLQNQELERQKEYERRLKQAKTREEFKKANDDLQIYLAELKKKEQAEEAKISEYARKRDQMEQLRRDKEQQKFSQKQKQRMEMIEKQAAHLASIRSREDEILNKQVSEAEEKARKLFEEKERRR